MESHIYDIPTSINKDLLIICPPFEEFNYTACDSFKEVINENALRLMYTYVLIDLKKVQKIDNNAIGAIFYAWRQCSGNDINLILCNPNRQVEKILNKTGIKSFIPIKTTYKEAIEEIKDELTAKRSLENKSQKFEQFFGNLYKQNKHMEYTSNPNIHNNSSLNFLLSHIKEDPTETIAYNIPSQMHIDPSKYLKKIFKNTFNDKISINNCNKKTFERLLFVKSKIKAQKPKNLLEHPTNNKKNILKLPLEYFESQLLLIEPDENLARKLIGHFKKLNISVKYVLNAADAFRFIATNNVDIVISELILPNSNGTELCRLIKEKNPHLYFVIMSGKTDLCYKLEAFRAGANDYISKLTHIDEIIERIKAANKIVMTYKAYNTEIQNLERVVLTDPLTGLYNRRYFHEELNKELDRSKRYNKTLALMVIDIDYFKKINDTYGHLVGDEVLKRVSNVLKSSTRQSDIICRIGGEEFTVLLPETDTEKAFFVAEKIRNVFAKTTFIFTNTKINITISVGISINENNNSINPGEFIDMADKALYIAKNEGRNRTIIYHLSKNHSLNI